MHTPRFVSFWPITIAALALLIAVLVMGCTQAVPVTVSVRADIPARPVLPTCPDAPHPLARVTATGVELAEADAVAIRAYLADAPRCWQAREVLLNAHVEKLENRLRAVAP